MLSNKKIDRDPRFYQRGSRSSDSGSRPRQRGLEPSTKERRIANALRKIAEGSPALGRHLTRSIRTGAYCVYEPG